jgi:hypothetical protein
MQKRQEKREAEDLDQNEAMAYKVKKAGIGVKATATVY